MLAFAVPVIASLGILGRRDELLEGVEVRWTDGGFRLEVRRIRGLAG